LSGYQCQPAPSQCKQTGLRRASKRSNSRTAMVCHCGELVGQASAEPMSIRRPADPNRTPDAIDRIARW
jgi:hypothetical protein